MWQPSRISSNATNSTAAATQHGQLAGGPAASPAPARGFFRGCDRLNGSCATSTLLQRVTLWRFWVALSLLRLFAFACFDLGAIFANAQIYVAVGP